MTYNKRTHKHAANDGQLLEPAKGTNSQTLQKIKPLARLYDTVVELFEQGKQSRLHAEIQAGRAHFIEVC